ncbi:NUDIX domain-containing protein [Bacillus sp. JJ1532]|uniref:NUDIX hydrolase n=1 Tax=Bacillus sp. JJ1532 TaxID=3122958 RepID=UPI002FFE7014
MTQNEIVLVVSVSIFRDNKVLVIKENKPFAINKWNFPSGRIENREDILNAACREVREETGLDVKLTGTTGIYNFISSSNHQVILFHFIGEVTGGILKLEEEEIVESKWMTLPEILSFKDQDLRDANVIKQIVNRLLKEKIHSITIFNEQLKG